MTEILKGISQLPETTTINYSELCQAAVRVMLARHN